MLHSAYSSVWSLRLTSCVESTEKEALVQLRESSKAEAQEFFGRSIGYFIADFCYVTLQLIRGHVPHLAYGRLAHHVVQSGAVFPAIFGGQRQTSSSCTYL